MNDYVKLISVNPVQALLRISDSFKTQEKVGIHSQQLSEISNTNEKRTTTEDIQYSNIEGLSVMEWIIYRE